MKPTRESTEQDDRLNQLQPNKESIQSPQEQPVELEVPQSVPLPAQPAENAVATEFWRLAQAIEIPEEGYIRNTGVGLRENEIEELDKIAKRLGLGRNSLIRFAVRTLLQLNEAELIALESVDVKPQRRTRKKIRITN